MSTRIILILLAMSVASCRVVTAPSSEEKASDEPPPAEQGSDDQSTEAEEVDIPVPIFLTDPDDMLSTSIASMGGEAQSTAAPDPTTIAGVESGGTETPESRIEDVRLFDVIEEVDISVKAIVRDYFKGQTAYVSSSGFRVFDVSAMTFPENFPIKSLRLSVDRSQVEPFTVQAFCEQSGLKECLRWTFAEAEGGKTRVSPNVAARQFDAVAGIAGQRILKLTYGEIVGVKGAMRNPSIDNLVPTIGFSVTSKSETVDRIELALRFESDGRSSLIAPNLPRARNFPSNIHAGDYSTWVTYLDKVALESARVSAFIPFDEIPGPVELPASTFDDFALELYSVPWIMSLMRTPTVNEGCGTTGTALRNAGANALPDDICSANTTVTDQMILDGLGQVCLSPAVFNLELVARTLPRMTRTLDMCGIYMRVYLSYLNPTYAYRDGSLVTKVLPPALPTDLMLALGAALKTEARVTLIPEVVGVHQLTFTDTMP